MEPVAAAKNFRFIQDLTLFLLLEIHETNDYFCHFDKVIARWLALFSKGGGGCIKIEGLNNGANLYTPLNRQRKSINCALQTGREYSKAWISVEFDVSSLALLLSSAHPLHSREVLSALDNHLPQVLSNAERSLLCELMSLDWKVRLSSSLSMYSSDLSTELFPSLTPGVRDASHSLE